MRQANCAPAPPKQLRTYSVTSRPFSMEIFLMAPAMFSVAMRRKPSATCSGVRPSLIFSAMCSKAARTASTSSG